MRRNAACMFHLSLPAGSCECGRESKTPNAGGTLTLNLAKHEYEKMFQPNLICQSIRMDCRSHAPLHDHCRPVDVEKVYYRQRRLAKCVGLQNTYFYQKIGSCRSTEVYLNFMQVISSVNDSKCSSTAPLSPSTQRTHIGSGA